MHPVLEKLSAIVTDHWVSTLFLLFTLSTILALLLVRWWMKRRWRRLIESDFDGESELDLLPAPGPQDQEALELIGRLRREIWELPDGDLQLNFEALSRRAAHIVRSMAAIYHPEVDSPQYEASLQEILLLIRRVSGRLARIAAAKPFSFLGDRRLSEYQRFYEVYRKINESPVLQMLRRHPYLQRAARWALNLKNLSNPLYWAGKELSREGYFLMLRWFAITFVTQVGKESMRLYSGRHFLTEKDRDATLVSYRLFALTGRWGGPSGGEWTYLVDFVTNLPGLEVETKLQVFSRCAQGALPKDLDRQRLQTKYGLRLYRDGLKGLAGRASGPNPLRDQLIREEMASIE